MITMDVKGITWVGNIYEKFENMCLEVEEMMYEDTVKYIENQVQTVGASVKKFCSDVVQDLLPPSSCDSDEKMASGMPIAEYTDAGICRKSYISVQERPVKVDAQKPTKDPRINGDFYRDVLYVSSHNGYCKTDALFTSASRKSVKRNSLDSYSRQDGGSVHIKSNLGITENRKHKKVSPTMTLAETTSLGENTCRTSSCELLHENHDSRSHHVATVSEPALAEATRLDSVVDSRNEIENASAEQIPDVPILGKSVKEKEMNTGCISSAVQSGESDVGLGPVDRTIQHDDFSDDTPILSHPDTWCWDPTETSAVIEQCHQTTQEDNKLDLEETCVMVNGNEVQSVPKAGVNQRSHKKKMRQAFSLCKKSARRQEYEQLAVWYGRSVKDEGNCVENSISTSASAYQKQSLLPNNSNISEPEWELV